MSRQEKNCYTADSPKQELTEHEYEQYITNCFGQAHEFSCEEYDLYARYFRKNYLVHMPEDKCASILDVGCGGGHFLYFVRQAGYQNAMGIDVSPECVELCRSMGLRAEARDAFSYVREREEMFDLIVCNDVLEHLSTDRGIELCRLALGALKPRGRLIVKVPNMACPVTGCRCRFIDFTHKTGYTDHSLKALLTTAGFGRTVVFGPSVHVTRSVFANFIGMVLFSISSVVFRILYKAYGVKGKHLMTKNVVAIARRSDA